MCSVIGVYSRSGEDVSREAFVLADALKHRGPVAFGFKTPEREVKGKSLSGLKVPESPVILGHCLLSTTGFGVQPLSSGKISISHNGQVYNYRVINPSKTENLLLSLL